MNPPTEAPDVPEDSGEYFQNLDRNPAYSQYDASSWQGNPAPDPAGLFTPTYPQYNQNQGPTNVHNAAAWSSYVPENGSQALNYYNGQHPYGLTNSTGASRPDTFSANYFAPDYSTGLGNPQQNNVVAPNQLQRVPVNGSSTSDHTQGLSMSSNPVRVESHSPGTWILTAQRAMLQFPSLLQRRNMRAPHQPHSPRNSLPLIHSHQIL
jgi:hypothetical protein